MLRMLISIVLIAACFNVIGCIGLGVGEKKKEMHSALVYELAEKHVTFSYHIPYFENYTIVNMQYTPLSEQYGTEEALFITYNANMFVTTEMKEAIEQVEKAKVIETDGIYSIYGPFYKADEIILPINLIIKKNPFEVVSPYKARTELYTLKIEDKEVFYDYKEDAMTSHGNFAYFVFELEKDGTYYRVYVQITSKMSEDEVKEKIKEMSNAILS